MEDAKPSNIPNVVLVHCHDLGRWLPVYGRLSVDAPNISSLAEKSFVFDSAFSTAPLCTPARSAIFTGLSPHENGLMGLTHDGWTYNEEIRTLPEYVGDLGVASYLFGLQHEDFDARTLGYTEVHGLGFLPRALEVSKLFSRWLKVQQVKKPFLAVVGMWEVHRPWPNEDYDSFDLSAVEVPPYLPDNEHTRRDLAGFYGAIRQLDKAVGEVIEAIDSSKHADNTIVVFTTDHGAAFPRAKGTLYDPGVEVSLIVRPITSQRDRAMRVNNIASHIDIAPSIVELMGGNPASVAGDGRSFAPLVGDGGVFDGHEEVFLEKTFHDRYDPLRAIRTDKYKYIRSYSDHAWASLATDLELSETRKGLPDGYQESRKPEELYCLSDDPHEINDLIGQPGYEEIRANLAGSLDAWMEKTNDPLLEGIIHAPPAPAKSE
jgi:arylsulfatase A-like enzyme